MQKLLSLRIASSFPRNASQNTFALLHSQPFKTLHSLTQKTPYLPLKFHSSHFVSTSSWRSQHAVFEKISGFLSNPLLSKQFLTNTLFKVLRRINLTDCRAGFLKAQWPRRVFEFSPSFDSRRRGWRSWFPRATADGVVLSLILANVAVFMLWRVADPSFMMKNFIMSLDNFKSGRVHTLITYAFSHIELEHIVSNMIGLYFFGMNIGRVFGPEFLLKLYLAGAIGGSVFYLVHHAFLAFLPKSQEMWFIDPSRASCLGASGAVNAIMLLNIFLFPKSTLYLEFIIPVPAMLLGVFLIGKDMLRIIEGDHQISGSAHLGGAAVAAIAWARIRRGRF